MAAVLVGWGLPAPVGLMPCLITRKESKPRAAVKTSCGGEKNTLQDVQNSSSVRHESESVACQGMSAWEY